MYIFQAYSGKYLQPSKRLQKETADNQDVMEFNETGNYFLNFFQKYFKFIEGFQNMFNKYIINPE